MRAALLIAFCVSVLSPAAFGADHAETLEAIMSHPRHPNYDVLRPMSGRWERCRASIDDPSGAPGLQDIFSSSDHSHFTRTLVKTSDSECKSLVSAERRSYECDGLATETLACHLVKVETKTGGQADEESGWAPSKVSESDLKKGALAISLKLLTPKKKRKKTLVATPPADDGRRLEVRITHADAPSAGDAESITLQFMAPRSTSSSAHPSSSSHH